MKLIHGDCLEEMKEIPDKSIDMILCDLPYGTTACKWDVVIPFNKYVQIGKKVIYEQEYVFDKMKSGASYKEAIEDFLSISKDGLWEQYKRIIKDCGAIVLFGSEPFSSYLRISNIKQYKYDWVWVKSPTGFLNAKKMPMKSVEEVCVFYKQLPTYNPQDLTIVNKKKTNHETKKVKSGIGLSTHNGGRLPNEYFQEFSNYPRQELFFPNDKGLHPTQKPVALLEYLIKTYTLEGETVLDNCMGSGSAGIACLNTNRHFIGIEMDDKYFEIGAKRIGQALAVLRKELGI